VSSVNQIVESVCALLEEKARQKGIEVSWSPNPEFSEIAIDPKGIHRCILNIVSNAVDACEDAKDARVQVANEVRDKQTACIKISDNGSGISDDAKQRLFKMFFSTKGSKGTGIGLAVTHKIIKEHDGWIDVDSKEGIGSTFCINLPLKRTGSETNELAETDQS